MTENEIGKIVVDRLTGMKLGFLLNFGAAFMKDGMTRIVNRLEE